MRTAVAVAPILSFLLLAPAARALPKMNLDSLEVCGQPLSALARELSPAAASGIGAAATTPVLMRIGEDLAYTPMARRPAAIACLRPQLRLGAPLPDGSALVIASVTWQEPPGAQSRVPCAVLVSAPRALSAAALYYPVPASFDATQQYAVFSESAAIEFLDLWNASALSGDPRHGRGIGLPPKTIYVARFDSLNNSAAIYVGEGRLDLEHPADTLRERIAAGDLQLLGAFNRFASEDAGSGERVLRWFSGFQDTGLLGEPDAASVPPPELGLIDQRALAQEVARALPQLAQLGLTPPRVHLVRLRAARSGDAGMRYEVVEEPLAAAVAVAARPVRAPDARAVRAAPYGRRALYAGAGVALLGLLWSGLRLWRRRFTKLAAQARDPHVPPGELLAGAIVRGDALGDAVRFAAPLIPIAIALPLALRLAHWSTATLAVGGAAGLYLLVCGVLAQLARARRHAGISPVQLGRHYGQAVRQLWQDLAQLIAREEQGDVRWHTERRLRTSLLEALSVAALGRRLIRQPVVAFPAVAGALIFVLLAVLLQRGAAPPRPGAQARGPERPADPRLLEPSGEALQRCLSPDRDLIRRPPTRYAHLSAPPPRPELRPQSPRPARPPGTPVPSLGSGSGPVQQRAGGLVPPPPATAGSSAAAASASDGGRGYIRSVVPTLRSRQP